MLPGERYGEPRWYVRWGHASGAHPDNHPSLSTTVSYEERRLVAYYAEHPERAAFAAFAKSDFLVNQTAMIKVVVGPSPESTWMVHEPLLTAGSAVAAAALSWPFKEKEEQSISFPDVDGTIFGYFVNFLYTRKIAAVTLDTALRLYVLGDRLQALTFRDMVFDHQIFSGPLTLSQLDYIMDNTIPGDRLRDKGLASLSFRGESFYTGEFGSHLSVTKELFRKHSFEILASRLGLYRELVLESGTDTNTESSSVLKESCSGTPTLKRRRVVNASTQTSDI